jgi:hypothetical protein
MNANSFSKSSEYQEFKKFMLSQFIDKPFELKTEGKSADIIALETKASELAAKKLLKGIRRFERMVKPAPNIPLSFK